MIVCGTCGSNALNTGYRCTKCGADNQPSHAEAPMRNDESGWLIEDRSPGDHLLYMKLGDAPIQCVDGNELKGRIFGKFISPLAFTKDAGEALRFARQADAEAFVRVFRRFMLFPEITEHCWPTVGGSNEE